MPNRFTMFMFSVFYNDCSVMTQLENGTVWITPGMKFHAPLMSFCNHEFQRIIEWHGSLSLCAHQPLAPGLYIRRIKCITRGTYLNDHSIHSIALMHIQLTDKF